MVWGQAGLTGQQELPAFISVTQVVLIVHVHFQPSLDAAVESRPNGQIFKVFWCLSLIEIYLWGSDFFYTRGDNSVALCALRS